MEGDCRCHHPETVIWHNGAIMPSVQVYGLRESDTTIAARRYFQSCGLDVDFINLAEAPMFPIDLMRFTDKFSLRGIIDCEGYAYVSACMNTRKFSDTEILQQIESTPALLLLPLVNGAGRLSIGDNRGEWARIAGGLSSKG